MKFILVGLFAILSIYQFSSTEAAGIGWRTKRSVALENCPENSTEQECLNYAEEQKNKSCSRFHLSGKIINWEHCLNLSCHYKGQELNLIQDRSKSYPDCCPKCDLSNVESPEEVVESAVL